MLTQSQLFAATMAAYATHPEPPVSELLDHPLPATPPVGQQPPAWRVDNIDVVAAMSHLPLPVGVMNFASPVVPGGSVEAGIKAQEESIAKGTYLVPALREFEASYYQPNRANPNHGLYSPRLIYSAHVRQLFDEHQKRLANRYLDIVTVAAPNRTRGTITDSVALADIQAKIIQTLRAFKAHACRHLVLGAFGTGVFKNPPQPVGRLFGRAIAAPEFAGAFTTIIFAVYDPRGETLPPFQAGLTAGFQEAHHAHP
jgi:uncharacterized protein (TIGR02452 family)